LASGAPPTSSLRPRGIPRRTLSRNVRPANYPRGVRSSPESCELRPPPARPFTGPAPSRRNRIFPGPCGSASREVLAPADTTTPGAPSPSRSSLRSPVRDEDRQTLVGAVLRVLAPLDGSSWLAARSRSFEPRRSPWPPTLRGLVPCRSRPWSSPPELSLPGEPYPLSRAVCSLAGSLSDTSPAQRLQDFHDRFRPSAPPRGRSRPPEGGPGTHVTGRGFLAVAESGRLEAPKCPARTVRIPPTLGSPVNGRHARF
jgi:hypothetical protein